MALTLFVHVCVCLFKWKTPSLQSVSSILTKFYLALLHLSVICNQCGEDLEQVAVMELLRDLHIQFLACIQASFNFHLFFFSRARFLLCPFLFYTDNWHNY